MKMKKLLSMGFLLSAVFTLTGCISSSIPTNNYIAQSYNKVDGNVLIGEFNYLPAEYGNVLPKQIENTAIGSIILDDTVANLVRQATALELRQSGLNVGSGNIRLDGSIKRFLANDMGYNVDWTYKINYRLVNLKNNSTLFDRDYEISERTPKLATSLTDLAHRTYKPIAQGFKRFIEDPEAVKILTSN